MIIIYHHMPNDTSYHISSYAKWYIIYTSYIPIIYHIYHIKSPLLPWHPQFWFIEFPAGTPAIPVSERRSGIHHHWSADQNTRSTCLKKEASVWTTWWYFVKINSKIIPGWWLFEPTPLKNMSSSLGMMKATQYFWENAKNGHQTTNQWLFQYFWENKIDGHQTTNQIQLGRFRCCQEASQNPVDLRDPLPPSELLTPGRHGWDVTEKTSKVWTHRKFHEMEVAPNHPPK